MPNGTVQAIGRSQSGKPQVTIDGAKYSTGKTDLTNMQVGDRIEFESNSSDYNGRTVWFLNSWKLLEAAKKYPPSQLAQQGNPVAPATQSEARGLTEAERIFAYGVTTEAIKAGRILEPEQIEKWVCAAKNALRSQGE